MPKESVKKQSVAEAAKKAAGTLVRAVSEYATEATKAALRSSAIAERARVNPVEQRRQQDLSLRRPVLTPLCKPPTDDGTRPFPSEEFHRWSRFFLRIRRAQLANIAAMEAEMERKMAEAKAKTPEATDEELRWMAAWEN